MTEVQALIEGWTYDLRDRPREKGRTIAEGQAFIEGWTGISSRDLGHIKSPGHIMSPDLPCLQILFWRQFMSKD